jgi:hypothetical protein
LVNIQSYIKKFNEDVYDDVSNYIISYTKILLDRCDMSVATDLKDLVNRLEGHIIKNRFISIYIRWRDRFFRFTIIIYIIYINFKV